MIRHAPTILNKIFRIPVIFQENTNKTLNQTYFDLDIFEFGVFIAENAKKHSFLRHSKSIRFSS